MRWLFVGGGNMASSLIGGLLGAGTDAACVAVADPSDDTCKRVEQSFGVVTAAGIDSAMTALYSQTNEPAGHLGVVIAVKPHIVEKVCQAWTDYLRGQSTVDLHPIFISVAAGVRVSSMNTWLPDKSALIRCMPNTPALLGLGATALFANDQCSDADKHVAQTLLDSAGTSIWVDTESALDAVTAVSGSGPAYFFYLIEHMTSAGVSLGLPAETAETLAIETAFGAASMARQRQHNAATLRKNVTSKGGTTAAALQAFDDSATPAIIHRALQAAHDRAKELGDDLSS